MPTEKLSAEAIKKAITELNSDAAPPWKIVTGKLHKTFVFRNFIKAFSFMTAVALTAEKINHHPEWSNVYKTVDIDLITHESGGITQLDFTLAHEMEKLSRSA